MSGRMMLNNIFLTCCTRVRNGQQPSKLDYVFTLHDNEVEEMNYLSPIGLSDHVGLIWKLNCSLAMRSSIPSFK